MNKQLNVVGFDPSLRNWGWATGTYCCESKSLDISNLGTVSPVITKSKDVRQNSKDLEAAYQLMTVISDVVVDAQAVFIEVPIGSQSARAMASYGICVGLLGALRQKGIPFFEVTPTEVKLAAVGNKNASKVQMIDWALEKHPEAPWPMYKNKGKKQVVQGKAEHMADAIGAIRAGTQSQLFQQLLAFSN